MIVHVMVPMHRHSLSPAKIAEHMSELLDPDCDHVHLVTVTDDEGYMLSSRSYGENADE
ncbi:hypothetical protein [Mycolicibacterium houstonense]|uniref:hypothetical protein n=1 Tax=Mycolicibacterium houstonense TaxID=146021 RepID=UPI000A51273C|nr:hypothetical protein [Mycolicibacterium houstonense]